MRQNFKAGTQYNDFVGTVAADRSDNLAFDDLLREKGLMSDAEHLVGFEIVFNENSGQAMPNPGIVAYLGDGNSVDEVADQRDRDGVIKLRAVEVFDLPLAELFAYFKRFDIMFANAGLKLDGQEYVVE
jgi:hypothetical protein